LRRRIEDEKEVALRNGRVAEIMRIVKAEGGTATKQDAEKAIISHDTRGPFSARCFFKSKQQKVAAKSYMTALKRLAILLKNEDLPPAFKNLIPVSSDQLKNWAKYIGETTAAPLPDNKEKKKWKRHAVKGAARFGRRHGVELRASKNGAFCRLAAVFDREAFIVSRPRPSSYFHACRDYLNSNLI